MTTRSEASCESVALDARSKAWPCIEHAWYHHASSQTLTGMPVLLLKGYEASDKCSKGHMIIALIISQLSYAQAVKQARRLVADGSKLLDVGGQSTRPGAAWLTADQELERVLPVIRRAETSFAG